MPIKTTAETILSAMATRGKSISASEWAQVKRAALREISQSDNPKATAKAIVDTFKNADRVLDGEFAATYADFVTGSLQEAVDRRKQNLYQPEPSNWSGSSS